MIPIPEVPTFHLPERRGLDKWRSTVARRKSYLPLILWADILGALTHNSDQESFLGHVLAVRLRFDGALLDTLWPGDQAKLSCGKEHSKPIFWIEPALKKVNFGSRWYFTLLQRTDKLSISFKVKIDISTRFKVSLFTVCRLAGAALFPLNNCFKTGTPVPFGHCKLTVSKNGNVSFFGMRQSMAHVLLFVPIRWGRRGGLGRMITSFLF